MKTNTKAGRMIYTKSHRHRHNDKYEHGAIKSMGLAPCKLGISIVGFDQCLTDAKVPTLLHASSRDRARRGLDPNCWERGSLPNQIS